MRQEPRIVGITAYVSGYNVQIQVSNNNNNNNSTILLTANTFSKVLLFILKVLFIVIRNPDCLIFV